MKSIPGTEFGCPLPGRRNLLRAFGLSLVGALMLTACGGTKVYESTKTVVYRGSIYNLTETRTVTRNITGKPENGQQVSLGNTDKKAFSALVKESGPVYVRMSFLFDDVEMLYRADTIDSWQKFSSMQKDFDRAGDRIAKLMKEQKSAQIELR